MKTTLKITTRTIASFFLIAFLFVFSGTFSSGLETIFSLNKEYSHEHFGILLIVVSLILSVILTKGKISKHGFCIPKKAPYLKIISIIFVIQLILTFVFSFFPIEGSLHFVSDYSLPRIIISVFLIASIAEEIFVRGLIQGFLEPVRSYGIRIGKVFLSLPVILCAFYFMAMHLPLITMGIDHILLIEILIMTFTLGLVAGYFREKTGSLLPAIVAHIFANVFSILIESILNLF